MTIPTMTTLEEKKTPWLKFSGLVVGRNSDFRTDTLTAEQIEQIGGTEYKALEMLSWMVPAVCFCVLQAWSCECVWTYWRALLQYFVGVQLIGFLAFGPWLSVTNKYDEAFQAQHRLVSKTWYTFLCSVHLARYTYLSLFARYSVFLVASSYTGTGLSLMDT